MKKTISLALSLCMLLVSLSGALIGTATATSTPLSYYENSENWISNGAQSVSAGTLNDQNKISNVTAPDGTAALKMSGNIIYSIKLDGISKNKDYVFTYKYYVPNTTTMANATKCWQKFPGIYQSGGTIKSDNSSCTGRIFTVSDKTGDVDTWHTVTFTFNSANNDILYFATKGYYASGHEIYLKDVSLVELDYYESPSSWRFYKTGKIGDANGVTTNSTHAFYGDINITADNSDASLKVTAHGEAPAVALKDLEVGKTYNFSFKYYVPTETKTSSAGAWLPQAGIYKKEAASVGSNAVITCNNNPLVGPLNVGTAQSGTAGDATWKSANLNFTVTEATGTDLYFAYRAWYGGGYIIYFDDFKLTECATDWKLFKNDLAIGDNGNAYAGSTTSWEHATISTDVDSGTPETKAVKLTTNGKAAAYKLSVTSNKKYSIKFKYYVPESANSGEFLSNAGVYVKGKTLGAANALTTFTVNTKGSWAEASAEFESGENTELYLAAKVNVGSPFIIYIDDITLTEKPVVTPNYYEDAANWEVYKYNKTGSDKTREATLGGNKVAESWESTTTVYDYQDKTVALEAHVTGSLVALPLTVEANKYYSFTFNYFVPKDQPYSENMDKGAKTYMKSIGVYAEGAKFNTNVANGNRTSGTVLSATVANAQVDGEWKKVTVNFSSKENTKVYFAAYCAFGTGAANLIYFADFALTEYPADWALFGSYTGDKVVNVETAAAPYFNWETITESDFVAEDANDDTSIKLNANGSAFAHKLDAVEANSRYTLTFKYFVPETSVEEDNFLSFAGVYAEGTTVTEGAALKCTEISTKGKWTEATVTFDTKDNTSVYFGAVVTAGKPSYTVYIDAIELTEVSSLQTSYNSTAAIRAANDAEGYVQKNGLRTYNQVLIDYIEGKEIVEYGSIVIRQGYLKTKFGKNTDPEFTDASGEETLIDFVGSGVGLGVAYRAEDVTTVTGTGAFDKLWESTSSEKVFTSYITGMPEENYDEEYLVRAYAIDKDGNVYYGNTSSISVFKVANAIDKASEVSDTDKNAFDAFVGASDTTKEEYITWCTNNSTSTGDLFTALNDAQ